MQLEANHLRQQHCHRLAQHGRFRLNSAHAPAQHAQAVDHGGVAVGADQRIRIGQRPAFGLVVHKHNAGQVFQVHLVHDARLGRHHAEVFQGVLAPTQEDITLLVPLIFQLGVGHERDVGTGRIDLHGVVDDQLHRLQRVDLARVAAHRGHGVAHGGQVNHGGHAGEVLQQYTGGREADLVGRLGGGLPIGHALDGVARHRETVFGT